MLILTRKLGESITIGDEIKVTLLDCHGKQVKLGINAPASVKVHREEIYKIIQEENKRAAMVSKNALAEIVTQWKINSKNADVKNLSVHKTFYKGKQLC